MKKKPIPKPGSRLVTILLTAAFMLSVTTGPAVAQEVRVAVAANFTAAAKEIGALFERTTGHKTLYSFSSTGQLYAQITQGAPFAVFLAADRIYPEQAVAAGLAVADSRFTYARGRLALFSRDPALVMDETVLHDPGIVKIAIANPVTAPYGRAAVAAMEALGVYQDLAHRIVQGNNISQTYQFVATGNAEFGFVALSRIARHGAGSRWLVPEHLHPPLAQDAVLLRRGADQEAAHRFLAFLRGPQAAAVKTRYGYNTGD